MNKNEFDFVDIWHKSLQHRERALGVDFHTRYNWLCVAQADGVIKLWDYEHDILLHNFFIGGNAMCVVFHRTRNMIAVGSNLYNIELLEYKINQQVNQDCTQIDDTKNGEEFEDVITPMKIDDENDSKNKNYDNNDDFVCDDYITLESQDTILMAHHGWVKNLSFYPLEFVDDSCSYKNRLLLSCGFHAKIWDVDERKQLCVVTRREGALGQILSCVKWCVIPKSNSNDDNRTFIVSGEFSGRINLFTVDIGIEKSKTLSDNSNASSVIRGSNSASIHENKLMTTSIDNHANETKQAAQKFEKKEKQLQYKEQFGDKKIHSEIVVKYLSKYVWRNPLLAKPKYGSVTTRKTPIAIKWLDIDSYYGFNGDTIFATSCTTTYDSKNSVNTQLDAIRLSACDVGGNVHILDIIIDDNNDFVDCIHSTYKDQSYTKVYFYHNMNQRFIFGSTFGPLNILNLGASRMPITTNHNIIHSKQSIVIREFSTYGQNGRVEHIEIKNNTNHSGDDTDIVAVCHNFGVTLYKINRNNVISCYSDSNDIETTFLSEEKQADNHGYKSLFTAQSSKDNSGLSLCNRYIFYSAT